tara:strand:+ start:35015 stop:36103 length:1089 start_codon:yes stop_codon:yes gene_type:complete
MKYKILKHYFKIPEFLIILVTAFIVLITYKNLNLIFKNDSKDGFLNATAISNKFNCRLKAKNKSCIKNVLKDLDSDRSVLFLGNSQTGSINNFHNKDLDFVSLLNENSFSKKNKLIIRSFWMPNASLKEFSKIHDSLIKCSANPAILIIPTFLDDTRENSIRKSVQNFENSFCNNEKLNNQKTDLIEGNLVKLNREIRIRFEFLNKLQNLNTRFRTDLYKIRNFILMIKPNSIRKIKRSSYFSNIRAYEKILVSRNKQNLKTIVYIPPLLYSNKINKIPYNTKEYKSFKKKIKEICLKNNCLFFNLESVVEDELWGNKLSTNIIKSENEIDFMHFTGKGHLRLSEEFSLIIKNHFETNSLKP